MFCCHTHRSLSICVDAATTDTYDYFIWEQFWDKIVWTRISSTMSDGLGLAIFHYSCCRQTCQSMTAAIPRNEITELSKYAQVSSLLLYTMALKNRLCLMKCTPHSALLWYDDSQMHNNRCIDNAGWVDVQGCWNNISSRQPALNLCWKFSPIIPSSPF